MMAMIYLRFLKIAFLALLKLEKTIQKLLASHSIKSVVIKDNYNYFFSILFSLIQPYLTSFNLFSNNQIINGDMDEPRGWHDESFKLPLLRTSFFLAPSAIQE